MLDGRQNTDFVKSILFFFVRQLTHLYFFQRVGLPVAESENRVDTTVSALAYQKNIAVCLTNLDEGDLPSRLRILKFCKDIDARACRFCEFNC